MKRQAVDWSCKHDILLMNPDGTFSPMDEPYFRAEKIAEGTWKILSAGDHSYLVEGENEAVSIDTGYGAGVMDAEVLDRFYACAKHILDGNAGVSEEQGGKHGMPPMPKGPNGETVYHRVFPHPGDGGSGKMMQPQNRLVMEHAGVTIIYSADNV